MKMVFAGALALALTAAPALAAPEHHNNNSNNRQHRTVVHREVHRTPQRHTTVTRRVTPHRTVVTRRTTAHHETTVHRKVTVAPGRNHLAPGRNHPVAGFHWTRRAPHRYRIGTWHAPRGFAYRRFAIGERIPAVLLAADFFLTGYAAYGLEAPPPGYIWVRDGDDAVLVDRYTGEVIAVEYDVFY
ncbi:MAG TPA: RcnB family protein [Rhizomicrobium sp.]|nr:RcnB family protein [Rhizomicrobium sp.]